MKDDTPYLGYTPEEIMNYSISEDRKDLEITQKEIMEGYHISNDLNDLFNSDIFILATPKTDTEVLDIKAEYKKLNIKHYIDYVPEGERYFADPITVLGIISIGAMVISTLSSLITLGEFLNKKYGSKKDIKIEINVYNKTLNNKYIDNFYFGDVDNFCNHEIEKMKDDFKYNGP